MYTRVKEDVRSEFSPYMRRLLPAYIGESQVTREGPSPAIDVKRAVAQNRYYEKKLKWDTQVNKIKSHLRLSSIASPENFAWAVATWQHQSGDNKPDGVIGPNTWAKLQSAMKAASSPPISPSQVSAVPNAIKDPKYLAIGIYEAEYMTLQAWRSSLEQFGEIMKAVSDKEGTTNFAGVLQKYILGKLFDTIIIKQSKKVVSLATEFLDALVAEANRANQAREGAQLRDFIVRFHRSLNDAILKLSARKDDYFYQVEKSYEQMGKNDKEAYKKQLVEYLDQLDKMREDGWLTGTRMFQRWAFEWIRNTTARRSHVGAIPEESFVIVSVNHLNDVESAYIQAPGGQKIAEQLLKDAQGAGLRPYQWLVRREMVYRGKNKWPEAVSRLTAKGELDMRSYTGADNEELADRKFKRLLALQPTTKDVTGK